MKFEYNKEAKTCNTQLQQSIRVESILVAFDNVDAGEFA